MTSFDPVEYKVIERQVYSMTASGYDEYGCKVFEDLAQPLLDAASLLPGQHILDVACGPGIPSLTAASLVAPGGVVTGIDLAPGMLDIAKKKAEEKGISNVVFREGDAEALPFPDDSFDVVLCSHGLVHMTDRMKALQEMRRVLKRMSGTLALSVWSTPDRAIVIGIVARTIRELWPAAVVPGAPMWFDFGLEGVLEKALSDAGFRSIRTTRHNFSLEVKSSEEYWDMVVGISGRLQMLLKNIPDEVASNIRLTVIRAAEHFRSEDDRITIPCQEVVGLAMA
ncbi:MAG: putative methyltransferase YcgJ [Syntrophorhabdus sp. PtaB.Bin047]|jgi:ubiquinone/menaquinone biosynthesis C-methylase UbiE|nr:MAG: putative methyltransferase YcgJ [Syntrophorhabdus sp. PtaB.Bin047]